MHPVSDLIGAGKHIPGVQAMKLMKLLGSAFQPLARLDCFRQLCEILYLICDVTVALDNYHRGGKHLPRFTDLIPARNAAQHKLLSLGMLTEEPKGRSVHICGEIVRLSALIFSDMVIFPLGPGARGKPRLAGELRELLDALFEQEQSVMEESLLLWALTLGGIAAAYTKIGGGTSIDLLITRFSPPRG